MDPSPEPVNPARHLETLVEEALAQKIFAVDLAYGFTRLETHLAGVKGWLARVGPVEEPVRAAMECMDQAMEHVRTFVEEKNLGALDRGLALCRSAAFQLEQAAARASLAGGPMAELGRRLKLTPLLERDWQRRWEGQVLRHQGESRAVFRCRLCGWEFVYVVEAPVGEVELPFSELACPFCDPV